MGQKETLKLIWIKTVLSFYVVYTLTSVFSLIFNWFQLILQCLTRQISYYSFLCGNHQWLHWCSEHCLTVFINCITMIATPLKHVFLWQWEGWDGACIRGTLHSSMTTKILDALSMVPSNQCNLLVMRRMFHFHFFWHLYMAQKSKGVKCHMQLLVQPVMTYFR